MYDASSAEIPLFANMDWAKKFVLLPGVVTPIFAPPRSAAVF